MSILANIFAYKISNVPLVNTCACVLFQLRILQCLSRKWVLGKQKQLLSKRKVTKLLGNVANQLFSEVNISGIFLLVLSQIWLGKWLSSLEWHVWEQYKFSEKWSNQEVAWYVFLIAISYSSRWSVTLCQSKIKQFPFLYHRFSSHFLDFPQKQNFLPEGPKSLQNSSFLINHLSWLCTSKFA